MDFLDLTSYSPTSESVTYPDPYDNTYQLDSYVPDYTFNSCEADLFSDAACFPTTPNFWTAESPNQSDCAPSASTSPSTAWPDLGPAPFGNLGDLSTAFTAAAPQTIKISSSPCLSPKALTHRSPSSSSSSTSDPHSEGDARPPPRKRGRPRLYRQSTGSSDSASEKAVAAYPQRLPHNQVERKYREGLNMELERLRRAVPTLPQGEAGAAMGAAKPSKAMVLQAAIEYIKKIEKERDEAVFQVERLRGGGMTAAMMAAI